MNYTENYQLPQWAKSDRILMDDFNLAMTIIEHGLSANAINVSAALSTANTAKTAANTAQSTANNAQSTANSAKTTADTALAEAQSTYISHYVGTGGESLHIPLTFPPKFLIINGANSTTELSEAENHMRYVYIGGKKKILYQVELQEDGFTVYMDPSRTRYPILNEKGRTYEFIAFR